ncbi:MAG: hypothetical protein Q8Q09_12960 [Deltaproteobacteria bacterium]|nr:hypothetical protein [Deltaproteobacteria bacterium]
MPLIPVYAVALNVLLWVSLCALAPALSGWPSIIRWLLVLLAPSALFALGLRIMADRRATLAVITAMSLGFAASVV